MSEEEVLGEGEELVEEGASAGLSASDTKLALAMRVIAGMKDQLENLERLLSGQSEPEEAESSFRASRQETDEISEGFSGKVIDGVFDGENMVGEDGRKYMVPPNYASKSKLVEGDLLRLNIADNGKFIFKQKGPIERQRLMGALMQDEMSSDWKVLAGGRSYKVLSAAVSFHRGAVGDDGVILVPKDTPSRWAALENVVKRNESDFNI